MTKLLRCQEKALRLIDSYAAKRRTHAQRDIDEVLRMSNYDASKFSELLCSIRSKARVCLHFHPDRPDNSLSTVAENLLAQGIYKNQFETGLSAGSVSAYAGGDRDNWERVIFQGAYHGSGVQPNHRPKYGALNLICGSDGPSPRFGSCFFVLKPEVTKRCTFTYLDSHQNPKEKGTIENFDYILAALLSDTFFNECALGVNSLSVQSLFDQIESIHIESMHETVRRAPLRNLNQYIEAQVHGLISLTDDVDFLVVDRSFQNNATGEILQRVCDHHQIKLFWNHGFCMLAADVPNDFRGASMPSLAKEISVKGIFNTRMIGDGVNSLRRNPAKWVGRGSYGEVLQEFKLLWHVLVKFGKANNSFEQRTTF